MQQIVLVLVQHEDYNVGCIYQIIPVNYQILVMKDHRDSETQELTQQPRPNQSELMINEQEIAEIIDEQEKDQQENRIQEITSEGWSCCRLVLLLAAGVVVVLAIILVAMSGASTTPLADPVPITAYFWEFTLNSYNQMSGNSPGQYIDVQKAKPFKQLPICVIIKPELPTQQRKSIITSIKNQPYRNYVILDQTKDEPYNFTLNELFSKISNQCSEFSILLFVNQPVIPNSLNLTCQYYQVFNMWMGYSVIEQSDPDAIFVEVSSMYFRLLQLLLNNDFYNELQTIKSHSVGSDEFNQYFLIALFELCRFNSKNISDKSLYDQQLGRYRKTQTIFISTLVHKKPKQQQNKITRISFEPLLSLDQDYRINTESLLARRKQFYNSNVTLLQPDLLNRIHHQVTHRQFQQILQFEQIIYLAPEHSLCRIDKLRMIQKYDTEKYSDIKGQLPLCVCIFSHNNQQHNRARKIIRSIARQDYANFHIVFVDDFSTDHTLSETMKQIERLKFPKSRVTIVQNLNHKFATYNYVNTAFTYCKENDIQIIMDGDDQLIGQNVFHFVNTKYQTDPTLWLMHTFYKTNWYGQGFNLLPFTNGFVFNIFGGRRFMYFISPLRTWSVKLIRSLPIREHLTPLIGGWYDTACDVALQYGLFQLAGGEKHGKYFPEINYLYFTGYGGNDDSTMSKNLRRNIIHFLMTLRSPLKPLQNLEQTWKNKQIEQILEKDRGVEYKTVKFSQNQF